MVASMAAIGTAVALYSASSRRQRDKSPAKIGLAKGVFIPTTSFKRFVLVRASDPQSEQLKSDGPFTSQEDLRYLWKLGGGSVIGAAAIKYGSVIFPSITRPNIVEAMVIISAPCIVAVLLLFNQSRAEK